MHIHKCRLLYCCFISFLVDRCASVLLLRYLQPHFDVLTAVNFIIVALTFFFFHFPWGIFWIYSELLFLCIVLCVYNNSCFSVLTFDRFLSQVYWLWRNIPCAYTQCKPIQVVLQYVMNYLIDKWYRRYHSLSLLISNRGN